MDDERSIFWKVAGGVATSIILALMAASVREVAQKVAGKQVLVYGRVLKGFVILVWALCVAIFIAAGFASEKDWVKVVGLGLMFVGLNVPLHIEFFGVVIEFDESGIRTKSPWRRRRQIPWSAVDRVWYSYMANWYVVETSGFGRIRLHDLLGGVNTLLEELEARGVPVVRPKAKF